MSQQKGPARTGLDDVEREFAETLREAAWIFEKETNGRFRGSITACLAVVRFIKLRGGGAELAGPFVRIAEAFADLEKGGKPALFLKKASPRKERDRSPDRKVIQRLAAVALEVLSKQGVDLKVAAGHVARAVNSWPGMSQQDVKDVTVINWRKQQQRLNNPYCNEFELTAKVMLDAPNPRAEVEKLLKQGPPGLWQG
jgi:hypothetical protein